MFPKTNTLLFAGAALALGALAILFIPTSPLNAAGLLSLLGLGLGMAVSANQATSRKNGCFGKFPVAASTAIYDGTLVFIDANGYANDDTASGVNRFAGVARDEYDNSSGSAGDKTAETDYEGIFLLTGSGFAQTSVGQRVYATDNYTITLNGGASGAVYIGVIEEYVSATQVWVRIDVVDERAEVKSVAAAGSAQGDAAQLTGRINTVSAADGTKGVVLPPASAGKHIEVYNEHASNGLKVYPATSDDINDGTTNAAVTIEGKTRAVFVGLDATTWAATFTADT